MSRTNVTAKQIRAPYNAANNTALHTKFAEHDTALDALETTVNGSTDYKASCRFATTASVTLASVGLTATDGVTPVAGNRVLVKDQSTASQNGIYVVGATAWTRATDCDASADVTSGMQVFVSEGTANGGRWFQLTTADPITLATTSLTFTEMPSADLLASTANGEGASLIGIEDSGTKYSAENVETALAEVKTLADAAMPTATLALTTTGNGADLIGSYDTSSIFTATTVRGQLQEVKALADAAAPSASLALTTTPGGASYVGIFDTAGKFTAENVEAALAEVKTLADAAAPSATLALKTTPGGASYIGVFDTATKYTGDTVEACLAEVKVIADAAAPSATLALKTTPGGASYVGVFDTASKYTADTVEACLAEVKTIADAAAPSATLALTTTPGGASYVGVFDTAGIYTGADVEACLAEVKVLADAAIALAKRTVTVGHADLTDAVNGHAQTVNVGAVLPANAVLLGHEVNIATLFSGGGASAVKMDLGGTDIDAIAAQMDVFTGAATGALIGSPLGIHPQGKFSAEQLVATFTPDGAHSLAGLDAGALTITVWYSVLA